MSEFKETRPSTKPTPVRFTEAMLKDIEETADLLGMSRQDVIRLSVAAGLKALRRLGFQGLVDAIEKEVDAQGDHRERVRKSGASVLRDEADG